MIIKIKQFIEKRLKQLFIKNEMNALSFKIENECFMDGSKSKCFSLNINVNLFLEENQT